MSDTSDSKAEERHPPEDPPILASPLTDPEAAPTLIRRAATWEIREPTELTFPTSHTHAALLTGASGWHILGASRRGKMHAHEAKYREDAWQAGVSTGGNWSLAAVADGGGSYRLSRLGAQTAVNAAIAALSELLPVEECAPEQVQAAITQSLDRTYQALVDLAAELSAAGDNVLLRDLATTLLLVAHNPKLNAVWTAQVGDGMIILSSAAGVAHRLGQADAGSSAGETIFITSLGVDGWNGRVRQAVSLQPPRMIAAMTDGVSDDVAESEENIKVLFTALEQCSGAHDPASALLEWLGYEKRGSFDDRTLVVIYPISVSTLHAGDTIRQ